MFSCKKIIGICILALCIGESMCKLRKWKKPIIIENQQSINRPVEVVECDDDNDDDVNEYLHLKYFKLLILWGANFGAPLICAGQISGFWQFFSNFSIIDHG